MLYLWNLWQAKFAFTYVTVPRLVIFLYFYTFHKWNNGQNTNYVFLYVLIGWSTALVSWHVNEVKLTRHKNPRHLTTDEYQISDAVYELEVLFFVSTPLIMSSKYVLRRKNNHFHYHKILSTLIVIS